MNNKIHTHDVIKSVAIFIIAFQISCSEKDLNEITSNPNVIVIMTDDQGIGDFGFMGNPYIKTPELDKLASQSLNLTNFYVSPVCAPTRASFMTGKFSERTGVYDTFNGGAIMSDEEITIAEVLNENGYETGIFGKWHLGDNYPYPSRFKEKEEIDATIAHIDLLPSILDLCGLEKPEHQIDGLSIFAVNDENRTAFENRTLFFEWGRGYPLKYRNFTALKGNYKLVGNTERHADVEDFELFNVEADPQEKNNIVQKNIQKATELKNEIDAWYDEIMAEKNNRRSFPSYIGTPHENPVLLNRNDAKGTPVASSGANRLNYWEVKALEDGVYDIRFHFIEPVADPGMIVLKMYPHNFVQDCRGNLGEWTFKNIEIKKGEYKMEPYYQTRTRDYIFPFYVSVERIDIL